jgi:hypothetical protein
MQVAYESQRAIYTAQAAAIREWQQRFLDTVRASHPSSMSAAAATAAATSAPGSPNSSPGDTLRGHGSVAAAFPHPGAGTRRTRKSRAAGKSFAGSLNQEARCPIALIPISDPIPAPTAILALLQLLAAAALAAWATPSAKFEVATAVLCLPMDLYVPLPRPPLDAPPPSPPPEPLPTDGYVWSAVGKTAFIVDGLELSPTKLDELNAVAEERQCAAESVPLPSEIAA